MHRILHAASCLLLLGPAVSAAPPSGPQWLWTNENAAKGTAPNERAFFRKTFEIQGELKSAVLATAADDVASVFVNGQLLVQQNGWQTPSRENLLSRLKPGLNAIALRVENQTGPAGVSARLKLEYKDGTVQVIVTDKNWLAHHDPQENWRNVDYDTAGWKAASVLGPVGIAPWGAVSFEGATAAATSPEKITAVPGFKVELLYSVPKDEQGSWVSLTNDPKGRLIVSDQDGAGLYRITPGQDAASTKVEKLDVKIGQAQGLLWAYDRLYVTVNGSAAQGSGVYEVRDTNGDDQFDEVKLLKKLNGGGEHGPHGLRLGPDGLIYVIAGNHTKPPEGCEPASPLRNWDEDLLLPRNPDGNGHATGIMAPGGWVARFDKDNTRWNLFCGGFRNPYDIAFNQDGELFTFDADMEWDTGTPWYRPTRVNHCTSAAEFGWRYGTGKWPAYYGDSLGAVVDIGLGSPTGIEFGSGAKFPAKYQRALYILDWTYGKIYAVHTTPDGASFSASFETFVEGRPLPVTDLCVNTDGAMYFTVGGRKTQSGLYRVTYAGTEPTSPAGAEVNPAATKAQQLRRQLELFHGRKDPAAIDAAWPHLNSTDRVLRYAARVVVEHQDVSLWQDRALIETRPTALIHALIALCRVGGKELQSDVLSRLNSLPFQQLTEEQVLDAMRCYQLAFLRLGGKSADGGRSVRAALDGLFPHDNELVSREVCGLLIYLESPGVAARAMARLKASQTQQDQMYYAFVLRNLSTGWTPELRREHFSWLNLAESKYRGGASFKKFVQQIRNDTKAKLSPAELSAYADVIDNQQSVEVVKLETTRQFVHNWQMPDLQPLLAGVEKARSFEKAQAAYAAAQCAKCHRMKGEGGDTGPDITGVGNRFDARYLLESLVEPSKVVSDQYRNFVIETTDGRTIAGRVINEDAEHLVVRTDPFAREPVKIRKSQIESRQPSKISEMPQGLINVLTKDEVLDLIAYLRSAGNPNDAAFAK